jgi:transcriptional regulator GlxA family with amidase domain
LPESSTCHLHPKCFSALFTVIAGGSPLRYVAQYRLDRARALLLSTDRPVREVAAAGFADPFYFSRAFRRAEGGSPPAYRMAERSPSLA